MTVSKASQREEGQDLAIHLQNEYDNEIVEVAEIRGAVSRDLNGAFKEWQIQAETLTRCKEYLFSLSVNPDPAQEPWNRDQYRDYIERTEQALGLGGQPRAIVFHTKFGRDHCHVVWSRTIVGQQRAVQLSHFKWKLMDVSREFARDYGLDLPPGYEIKQQRDPETLADRQQERDTGLSTDDHKERIGDAWSRSDNAKSFVRALEDLGYILARGERPYVLVDGYGGTHSLTRRLRGQIVNAKEVYKFLEADFPVDLLPKVEEVHEILNQRRAEAERQTKTVQLRDELQRLREQQVNRREPLKREAGSMAAKQEALRTKMASKHKEERKALNARHRAEILAIRQRRAEKKSSSLGALFGKVSGVALIRRAIQRHQDSKVIAEQRSDKKVLGLRLRREHEALEFLLSVQSCEIKRKLKALERIDKREFASLLRDDLRQRRERARGPDNAMPPVERAFWPEGRSEPDLASAFGAAEAGRPEPVADIRKDFYEASSQDSKNKKGDDRSRHQENEKSGKVRSR